jgi:hypothetical protein
MIDTHVSWSIVNIYDMVWKPFLLGDCVPTTYCRVTVEKSFVFLLLDDSQFRKLGKGNGYQVFVLPTRAISYGIFCK